MTRADSAVGLRSMPEAVQIVMLAAPTTHFVKIAQGILYRGAGLDVVWKPCVTLFAIGTVLFGWCASAPRSARWCETGGP